MSSFIIAIRKAEKISHSCFAKIFSCQSKQADYFACLWNFTKNRKACL